MDRRAERADRSPARRGAGARRIRERLEQLLTIGTLGTPQPAAAPLLLARDGKQNQPVLDVREGEAGRIGSCSIPTRWPQRHHGARLVPPEPRWALLAYGLSDDGNERSVLHLIDLETLQLRARHSGDAACNLAWMPDSSGFCYTRFPAAGRCPRAKSTIIAPSLHRLGDDPAPIARSSRRPERALARRHRVRVRALARVSVARTFDPTDLFLRDLHDPVERWVPVAGDLPHVFDAQVVHGTLWLRTNLGAPNYRLVAVDPQQPRAPRGGRSWPRARTPCGVAVTRRASCSTISTRVGPADGATMAVRRSAARAADDRQRRRHGRRSGVGSRSSSASRATPCRRASIARCSTRRRSRRSGGGWTRTSSPSGSRWSRCVSGPRTARPFRCSWCVGAISTRRGRGPLPHRLRRLQHLDGAEFSRSLLLWLERGGIVAVPNLRGGGEYGEAWHQGGCWGQKQNTFDDFIAAAEWLIAEGWTTPALLAAQGGSNGGLLMGAVVTQRPDLFRAVIIQVPLLDMLRYHLFLHRAALDSGVRLAGRPGAVRLAARLFAVSSGARGHEYPAVLLATAESDTRVDPLHARKMAARLQAATSGDAPMLLRPGSQGGAWRREARGQGARRAHRCLDLHRAGAAAELVAAAGSACATRRRQLLEEQTARGAVQAGRLSTPCRARRRPCPARRSRSARGSASRAGRTPSCCQRFHQRYITPRSAPEKLEKGLSPLGMFRWVCTVPRKFGGRTHRSTAGRRCWWSRRGARPENPPR